MDIKILYCEMCGGRGQADETAAEITKRFGVTPIIEDVSKGRFEVTLDGRTIFSKAELGRFPRPGEIVNLLRSGK
jgi:selT/selW/selH-like putative selenoprotein